MGAVVRYCGHDASFVADVFVVGNVNVVRANGPVKLEKLKRPAKDVTHHLVDFPQAGFWRPDLGVFVVPQDQVTEVTGKEAV
jgi:hypothetical protein